MYTNILLVNSSLSFYVISLQCEFYNRKKQWCQGRSRLCQQITVQEHTFGEFALVHLTFVCAPPQLTLFTSPITPSTPWHVRGIQFRTLEILQSPNKFTGKCKTQINIYVYIYFAHHLQGK